MCLKCFVLIVKRPFLFTILLTLSLLMVYQTAHAFLVAELPEGNLLQNPWFRSTTNPERPGLDYWTDAAGENALWSTSQKESNPSPDAVVGTAARFARGGGQGGGVGQGGVDAHLFQVVTADADKRKLVFFTHWVTGGLEEASITIYGSDSASGPWLPLWSPLALRAETSSGRDWTKTPFMEQILDRGYPYYKLQIHLRYPVNSIQGGKFTGIYLAALDINDQRLDDLIENPSVTQPALPATPETAIVPTSEPQPGLAIVDTPDSPTSEPQPELAIVDTPDSTGVLLSATAVLPHQITLHWTLDSISTRFRLERSVNGVTTWQEIARPEADATTFSDTNIEPGVAYAYRLHLSNLSGNSNYSNVVQVVSPSPTAEIQATRTATSLPSPTPIATRTSLPEQIASVDDERPPETTVEPGLPPASEVPRGQSTQLILSLLGLLALLLWFVRSRFKFK